jgi:peptide/nickel transport system permease protein
VSRYLLGRLLQVIPAVLLITIVCFILMQFAPGGPATAYEHDPYMSQRQINTVLQHWCLSPHPGALGIVKEFGGWTGIWNCQTKSLLSLHHVPNFLPGFVGGGHNGILHGDLGYSLSTGQPVMSLILERLPATLILMITAWIAWVAIATIVGVVSSVRRYSWFDRLSTLTAYVLYSLPSFWLGLLLIYALSVNFRLFPAQGIVDPRTAPAPFGTAAYWHAFLASPWTQVADVAHHLVLPALTVVAVHAAEDSRFVRAAMTDVLRQDYIRTARSKGLAELRVILKHGLRNALLPLLTKLPLEVAFLFQGAVVAETVFSWPGIGLLFYQGVYSSDYFLLLGILLIGAFLIVLANIAADLLYALADPRIRFGRPVTPSGRLRAA